MEIMFGLRRLKMSAPKDPKKYEEWKRKIMLNLITPEFRKGKTDEEIYGPEKAKEISKKISKAGKERKRPPWNKDKKGVYSQETLQQKRGYITSEETKAKLRTANTGNPKLIEIRSKRIFPKYDTKIEVKIQMFLREIGYEFFTHQYMKIEHGYQCDILIPALNLVIECDGDYWHKYPIGLEKDHIRTKELLEKGFKVLRLWECEIKEMSIDKFKEDLDIIKNLP